MATEAPARRDAAGPAPVTWWVLGGLVVVLAAVGAGILWRLPLLIVAVAVGALLPVLVGILRRRRVALTVTVVLVGLAGVLSAVAVRLGAASDEGPDPGAAPEKIETVAYRAEAVLDGRTLRLDEEISGAELGPDAGWVTGFGWRLDRTVDGVSVYRRSRETPARAASPAFAEVELPITLGRRPDGVRLMPGDGSLTITAPKGALGVIAPAPQGLVDAPRRQETATVPLDAESESVLVTVRAPWLRNPLGRSLDDFFSWGPAAWLVGAATTVLSTIVVTRVTGGIERLLGGVLGRLRPGRSVPPTLPAPERTPAVPPRRPPRAGAAGLVRRRRTRR
ncbi:hypothetical protein E1211_10655 [Micromonospora sp. 15K316]|uniref:hypothetical protein n=1 Tax=Micromonospora sp. 15K316 TaxID=2530376 RepID=UPI0010525D77|nr:hypothetical protein [Micromonospora sp. 15K316]TDC37341.1 hypothetical protein E1211_10655 [Micromonospora sp. 15K316]